MTAHTKTYLRAAAIIAAQIALGVTAVAVDSGSELATFLTLVALFPFGLAALMITFALQGVHGGSEWTMIVMPILANFAGNTWLLAKWLRWRDSNRTSVV